MSSSPSDKNENTSTVAMFQAIESGVSRQCLCLQFDPMDFAALLPCHPQGKWDQPDLLEFDTASGKRQGPALCARTLAVMLEELMGEPATKAQKRGPAPKLAQHMEKISQLPKPKQRFVMEMLDTVLAQQSR